MFYNFKRLLSKYGTTVTLKVPATGSYDKSGRFVQGKPESYELQGAVIGLTKSKIYRSEGTLTQRDKYFFCEKEIDKALEGAYVLHNNKKYNIASEEENAEFTGVYMYILKYVSVFEEEDENG